MRAAAAEIQRFGAVLGSGREIRQCGMTGTRARHPAGGAKASREGPDLTHQEAADYIASMLEGLRLVAQNAQMPFLAYLINVAVEEASSEKTNRD